MKRLFSPWRSKYIESISRSEGSAAGCVLCDAAASDADEDHLIVARGSSCFVIMNLFPYNSGHLMIVPYRHIPSLIDLNADESKELMELLQQMMRALLKVLRPDGFNVGTNVGRPAGAGIDQHVHLHVVPRWNGDTNFLPILADTKVISDDMRKTLADLRKAL